jgi:hypothetical protein
VRSQAAPAGTTNCDTVRSSTSVSTARTILRDTGILYCTDTANSGISKVVPVDAMKAYGSGGIPPHVLNPGIRRRQVFRLTPRPLYPGYPLIRTVGRWQCWSGRLSPPTTSLPCHYVSPLPLRISPTNSLFPATAFLSTFLPTEFRKCERNLDVTLIVVLKQLLPF